MKTLNELIYLSFFVGLNTFCDVLMVKHIPYTLPTDCDIMMKGREVNRQSFLSER